MTDDTPHLDRLLALAQVNVKQFTRMDRGRMQVVHAHVANRAAPANPNGWIPQKQWDAGQAKWIAEGEAAWKKGQAARGGVRPDANRRPHAGGSAKAQARAQRMAARSNRLQQQTTDKDAPSNGSPMAHGGPPGAPGSLQDRVQAMESDRQRAADKVGNHTLFNQQQPGTQSPSEQLINDAANRAVQDAALKSGQMDENELSNVMSEVADMEAKLATQARSDAKEAANEVNSDRQEEARAVMALNILGIIAGILMVALTGGAGAIIGEVMAFGWTVEVGRELAVYHGITSGRHPMVKEVLAHPAKEAAKGTAATARVAAPKAKAAAGKAKSLAEPLVRKRSGPASAGAGRATPGAPRRVV